MLHVTQRHTQRYAFVCVCVCEREREKHWHGSEKRKQVENIVVFDLAADLTVTCDGKE